MFKQYAERYKRYKRHHKRKIYRHKRKEGWMDLFRKYYHKYSPAIWRYARKWFGLSRTKVLPTRYTARRITRRRSYVPYVSRYNRAINGTKKYVKSSLAKSLQSSKCNKTPRKYYHQITDVSQLKPNEQTISFEGELYAIREIGADIKRYSTTYGVLNPTQTASNFTPLFLITVGTGENQRIGSDIKVISYRIRLYIKSSSVPLPCKLRWVVWLDKSPQGVDTSLYSTPGQPATPGGPYNSVTQESDIFVQDRNSTNMNKYKIIHIKDIDCHVPPFSASYAKMIPQLHEFHFKPEHTTTYNSSTGAIADLAENNYKFSIISSDNAVTTVEVYAYVDIHYKDA